MANKECERDRGLGKRKGVGGDGYGLGEKIESLTLDYESLYSNVRYVYIPPIHLRSMDQTA